MKRGKKEKTIVHTFLKIKLDVKLQTLNEERMKKPLSMPFYTLLFMQFLNFRVSHLFWEDIWIKVEFWN